MRRYLKTQCLAAINVLTEAHADIEKLIDAGETTAAAGLLEQCQDSAIKIGEIIDRTERENTEEVHQLEIYCEKLYQIHENLVSGVHVNARKAVRSLDNTIRVVSSGISERFLTQREVVFLPYNASMWDSLETLWEKEKSDPNSIVYVVPIPYYEKNADGTVRKLVYDLDKFPKNVPVVSFRKYNIEERHPDAIYIHNPYDDLNFVTSVPPEFYSPKLKQCTDELVYTPYYVLDEIDPENKAALKAAWGFVVKPGVINSDRVIVQSENWRKVYIELIVGVLGEEHRAEWEKKVEVLPSSKLVRAKNLKAWDYDIPPEWMDKILDSEGNRKKIIFYNVSLGTLLREEEKEMQKIERVLDIFKENLDKVTLLWRPHPLVEATLASMKPALLQWYLSIVKRYREENWGIFDDSAEIDRAIAVSDAYYGDDSSVVWMYKETGKPIMIQNCSI